MEFGPQEVRTFSITSITHSRQPILQSQKIFFGTFPDTELDPLPPALKGTLKHDH
jgi:hypothetical protein